MNKLHWSIHKYIHSIEDGLRYLIGSKERIDFEAANKLVLVEARHPDARGRDRDHPDASCSCQISIFTQSSLTFCKEFVKFPRLLCHGRGVMCMTDAPDCSLSLRSLCCLRAPVLRFLLQVLMVIGVSDVVTNIPTLSKIYHLITAIPPHNALKKNGGVTFSLLHPSIVFSSLLVRVTGSHSHITICITHILSMNSFVN